MVPLCSSLLTHTQWVFCLCNPLSGWFCERVLCGSADFPVRVMHWVAGDEEERLLSTGPKGIVEWDLARLRHKTTATSYGMRRVRVRVSEENGKTLSLQEGQ